MMRDPIEQFRMRMQGRGIITPAELLADGRIHRCDAEGTGGKGDASYVLHLDGIPAGGFENHRDGLGWENWRAETGRAMTPTERQAHRQRVQAMRQQREADMAQRQQQAAQRAAQRWQAAIPASEHPYLSAKGVKPYGVRLEGEALLIPMRDTAGTLHSLQVIDPEGGKRFQPGGRVQGCYHAMGKPDGVLIICEGYATGASLHEATGQAVAVAFNAGNLEAVAQALRQKYPKARLIVAADDDWRTDGNPGLSKATAAARAVGGWLAVPQFPADRPDKATDFNDLHQLAGLQAVRACIDAAVEVVGGPVFPALDGVAGSEAGRRGPEVVLVNGADVVLRPVRWLWPEWLALGKLHILAGAPGQGKTTIALAFAATVTTGGRWPDGTQCEPGNVLIWSGEDDAGDTLLPRLLAAGADRSRCHFVSGTRIGDALEPFDPARDMAALEAQAHRIGGVRMLIVDPVVSAVQGDSHKNTEVRRALQPLVDLAARLNAAVLGISHFSKGGAGNDPASRVVGSVAFTAVARVVLVAAKVKGEGESDRRILARGKSNIGPDDGGFEYHIEQGETIHEGIRASYVTWGQRVAGTARELLAEPGSEPNEDQGDAVEMLRAELASGCWTNSEQASAPLRAFGFTKKQIWTASKKLGVIRKKGGMHGGWYWRLPGGADPFLVPGEDSTTAHAPEDSTEGSEGSMFRNVESLESSTGNGIFGEPEKPNLSTQLGQDVQRLDGGQVGQLDGQVAQTGLVSDEDAEVF